MAMPHLSSSEVTSLLPLGDKLEQTPTRAFFKDERMEVMRNIILAGKRMPAHAVAGPITLQCLEGEVDVITGNTHKVMVTGDLMYLAGGALHELVAIKDSALLVTIVLIH